MNIIRKKSGTLVLAIAMALSLAACGGASPVRKNDETENIRTESRQSEDRNPENGSGVGRLFQSKEPEKDIRGTEGTEPEETQAASETEQDTEDDPSPEKAEKAGTKSGKAQKDEAKSEKAEKDEPASEKAGEENKDAESGEEKSAEVIRWNSSWPYASFSKIHTGTATLYHTSAKNVKNFVVAVNAGHGTGGGESVKTQCHPDGSPKVTGGSTAAGSIEAVAVSGGMTFNNGTSEAAATLSLANLVRQQLLDNGYDVLMIRESEDVQLDNIARTVMANNNADCHIALHYDSSSSDKGLFYCKVPDNASYRAMEPVAGHYREHIALGDALVQGAKENGQKVLGNNMAIDLTQTSYSTVPSVDLEVGDKASDISQEAQKKVAAGILKGMDIFYQRGRE